MNLRDRIMAMPEGDRLEAALVMLEEALGADHWTVSAMRQKFGLSALEARVLAAINARAPMIISREALLAAAWGIEARAEKSVDVIVHRLRKRVPFKIVNHRGLGYQIRQRIDLSDAKVPVVLPPQSSYSRRKWSEQDDDDLRCMVQNGSDLTAIAYELDRTLDAVIRRVTALGLSVNLQVAA